MPHNREFQSSYMLKHIRRYRYGSNLDNSRISILTKFYPDKMLTTNDIEHDKNSTYGIITYFVKQNYLEKVDNHHLAARYRITPQGKYRVLCHKLKIKFLCLCILAEAYTLYKHQLANGCNTSYTLCDIKNIFEEIYARKTISNARALLSSKGYIYNTSKDMIKLREDTVKKLQKHEEILGELHDWITGITTQLNMMIVEDPHMLNKIKNMHN